MIRDAATYPFRGENAPTMAIGAAFFALPSVAGMVVKVGLLTLLLQILVIAYFAIFFHSVMESSTKGLARAPAWPEEINGWDILERVFDVIVPVIISFLPLIVLRLYWMNFGAFGEVLWKAMSQLPGIGAVGAFGRDVPAMPEGAVRLSYGFAALGFAYLPMALLLYNFYGGSAVVNVVAAVRSIGRIPFDYLRVVITIVVLFAGFIFVVRALEPRLRGLSVPFGAALLFYVVAVAMRAIGLLYARNRDRLGWEPEESRAEAG